MDSRYKKKAVIGVVAWVIAPFAVMLLGGILGIIFKSKDGAGDKVIVPLLFMLVLIQYFLFFWGGSHLAKAKGYSNGILLFGILGCITQLVVLGVLLFALPDKCSQSSHRAGNKRHGRDESQIARIVRYRRKAFVGNLFGALGIFLAVALIFLPFPIAIERDTKRLIALAVFLPSYAAVISGCYWWVKAKNWHDAVVFIGLMPLGVLLIPYVRLIFIVVPLLLPTTMALMPIIMIGVVAVLPDKSGIPKRKRWNRH